MNRIVTFGELLLRFSKSHHDRLTQGGTFDARYGGSEANVAVSLATLGDDVSYVTRLPDTPVGHAGAQQLAQYGVDVSSILYGGRRIGTYYYEAAAGMRNTHVIYDRTDSAYSELAPGMIPWQRLLSDATIFQASGISAAISQSAADATFEGIDIADRMGITISYDINYRKNLWRYPGAEAHSTLCRMLSHCDVMFGDVIEFEYITQRRAPLFDALSADYVVDPRPYAEWFDDIHRCFPRCRKWLMGIRNQISSSHHTLTALLWSEGRLFYTRVYDIPIVDPMGVGDAFLSAFLHSLQNFPGEEQLQLDFSLAAAALKNSVPGDFNLSTHDEIMDVVEGRLTVDQLYKTFE